MGLWDALSNAMSMLRKRRIGPREAEQLLTADSDASTHPELGHLLAAAAAPPQPDELAGLWAAVAAFEEAGRDTGVTVVPARRRWLLTRSLVIKAAAGTAVVLFGGTALAAQTGNLPGDAQQRAHDLFSSVGIPPPAGASPAATAPRVDEPSPTTSPTATPAASPTTSPTATPGGVGRTLSPNSPAALGLCQAWEAVQKKPNGKPMDAEAFRDLAARADGEARIAAFCAPLLDGHRSHAPVSPTPRDPGAGPPTPSHPVGDEVRGRSSSTPSEKG